MLTAALFILAKMWKQSKCPSTDDWITKTQYNQTVEYYSVIKSNEVLTHAVCAQSFSCVQLFATPQTIAGQAPPSLGTLQARILQWVAMPSSRGSSQPGIKPRSPALQADSLPSEPPGYTLHATIWINLEDRMLSKKTSHEKTIQCMTPLI